MGLAGVALLLASGCSVGPSVPSPGSSPTVTPSAAGPSAAPAGSPSPEQSVEIESLPPIVSAAYAGETSQGLDVTLTVGPTGFLVAPTEFVVRWTCSEGTTTESYYSLGPGSELPIVDRTFTLFEGPGEEVSGTFVTPERIEGSGRFAQQMTTPTGTTMSCDSDTFTWTAAATGEPPPEAGPLALTLGEALDQGLVEVELQGRGGAAGDTIVATLFSMTSRPLEIEVSEGTRLESADDALQDMVVRRLRGIDEGPLTPSSPPR